MRRCRAWSSISGLSVGVTAQIAKSLTNASFCDLWDACIISSGKPYIMWHCPVTMAGAGMDNSKITLFTISVGVTGSHGRAPVETRRVGGGGGVPGMPVWLVRRDRIPGEGNGDKDGDGGAVDRPPISGQLLMRRILTDDSKRRQLVRVIIYIKSYTHSFFCTKQMQRPLKFRSRHPSGN